MTGFLLDTNVISELTKSVPDPGVISFVAAEDDLWLSSVVIHEMEYGLQLLPSGQRRNQLYGIRDRIVATYQDRILVVDQASAKWAARFRAEARRSGRVIGLGDALIAGTAKRNSLTVATRNVADFEHLDVAVRNPWEDP